MHGSNGGDGPKRSPYPRDLLKGIALTGNAREGVGVNDLFYTILHFDFSLFGFF